MKIKKTVRIFLSDYPFLDYAVRYLYTFFSRLWFYFRYRGKIDENTFFFESFQGRNASDSPLALYKEVRKRMPDASCFWAIDAEDNDSFIALSAAKNTQCVIRNSTSYFMALAKCQYLIFNSRTPFFLKSKKNQSIIQCWHGTPLKKLGHDITCDNQPTASLMGTRYAYSLEAEKCDYFISPSPYVTKCLKSAFAMNGEKILELGYPRNDELVIYKEDQAYKNNIKQKLGLDKNKKIILYAPTYRDTDYSKKEAFLSNNKLSTETFLKFIRDKGYIVLFRGHYFTKANSGDKSFVNVSRYGNINDLMLVSDLLITDYSSLMFDYLLLEKPIFLYLYDREKYFKETRGVYLNIDEEVAGKICYDEQQLIMALNSTSSDMINFCTFNKRYNPYEDGHSATRVLSCVTGNVTGCCRSVLNN